MSNVFLNNCEWSFITSRFWTRHTGKGRNDDHHSDSKQQPPPMSSILVIPFGYPQFYLSLESLDCPLPWNHWFEIGRSRYHGWTVSTPNAMVAILFGYPQSYLSLDFPLHWSHWCEIGRPRFHGWTVWLETFRDSVYSGWGRGSCARQLWTTMII